MISDTPRTDSEERWAEWNGEQFQAVDSSFSRELERELNAALLELEMLRKKPEILG